jgi:RNA polymerase sigma factor (sigma-70 family)
MAAEHYNQPGQQEHTPEKPQPTSLERAMHGVSLFLKLDDAGRVALQSHFLPGQPDCGVRRRALVARKVAMMFGEYFDSHRTFLLIKPFCDADEKAQTQLRMQRSLMRQLFGDSANAIASVRLQTLIDQRPEWTDELVQASEDAFIGMLDYYARKHHLDLARLIGSEGVKRFVRLGPQMEPIVMGEEGSAPDADLEPELESDEDELKEPEPELELELAGSDEVEPESEEAKVTDESAAASEFQETTAPTKPKRPKDGWSVLPTKILRMGPSGKSPRTKPGAAWASVAELSKELGPLEQEAGDPDWPALEWLRSPARGDFRSSAYLGSNALHHRILSRDEQRVLFERMQTGLVALELLSDKNRFSQAEIAKIAHAAVLGYRAREILVAYNLRFVRSAAIKYFSAADQDDVLQSGNLGLIEAIDNYDPFLTADHNDGESKASITTFGNYHVRGRILRTVGKEMRSAVVQQAGKDVLGVITAEDRRLLMRSYEEAQRENPGVSHKEVGRWLGFSEAKVARLLAGEYSSALISLQKQHVEDDATFNELLSFIEDPRAAAEMHKVDYDNVRQAFWRFVRKKVTVRHYQVLVSRYVYGMTQLEISKQVGVSRERVRQIEQEALKRLGIQDPASFGLGDIISNGAQTAARERAATPPSAVRSLARMTRGSLIGAVELLRRVNITTGDDTGLAREQARQLLGGLALSEKEEAVVELRYGLGANEQSLTQQQVADRLGITRGYVAVIDTRVVRKLLEYLEQSDAH